MGIDAGSSLRLTKRCFALDPCDGNHAAIGSAQVAWQPPDAVRQLVGALWQRPANGSRGLATLRQRSTLIGRYFAVGRTNASELPECFARASLATPGNPFGRRAFAGNRRRNLAPT
jgi:hypothetical protein